MLHKFHIPVLGLGYSIDTPLKVGRYGISSTISIVDDELCERMREYHAMQYNLSYIPIKKDEVESRARRITAYLNQLQQLADKQFEELVQQEFTGNNDIDRYFELLPAGSQLKHGYELMQDFPQGQSKLIFQNLLRSGMQKGSIDVNIMAKVDKMNFDSKGNYLGDENTDALASLRGFALSELRSSVVLSAGMNPKLYSYLETFEDFYPDKEGKLRKQIILKVSDYRSALIQAKFLAKKGLWVSEFRVESGLNCGGHAFATDGLLLGPILEEFKQNRSEMQAELWQMYNQGLNGKGKTVTTAPAQKLSAQGGVGTSDENDFLLNYYQLDATGWGSPFLLVPEATNVDEQTLNGLAASKQDDFYLSASSPLGVLFNNYKNSTIEEQRLQRILKGRPGSPCTKKYLCSNTEFTNEPICTASRQYQNLKLKQLQTAALTAEDYDKQYREVTEKVCLCEGLCASVYLKNNMLKAKEGRAVAICPGPNLAYFNRIYTLDEMVKHIYGRLNLIAPATNRPNLFINELNLYIDYFRKEITAYLNQLGSKKVKQLQKFASQLEQGISYYKQLLPQISNQTQAYKELMYNQLINAEKHFQALTNSLL